MSLRINHNLAALNANRNLELTTFALNKSMQKLSSGFRINAAADDPAGLVISEQFRSQIAGLNRAIMNSEGSISMIQTAEGALTEINSLLISMRELAIHAANEGFNDADQLQADQAEIDNAMATIDRISVNTQFAKKKILDGTKDNIAAITSSGSSGINILRSNLDSGTHSITATKTADATATLNTTSLGLSLTGTDGDPANLTEAIHNVDVIQASDVAKKVGTKDVDILDAWSNGVNIGATAIAARHDSTAVVADATAGSAGTYTFTINYQENGESPSGAQTIQVAVASGEDSETIAQNIQTAINSNAYLAGKVTAFATAGSGTRMQIYASNAGAQYSVAISPVTTTADPTNQLFNFTNGNDRGTSTNGLNFTVVNEKNGTQTVTATVTAGTYTTLAALAADFTANMSVAGGAFGTASGTVGNLTASVVDGKIQFASADEGSDYSVQLNSLASTTGQLRNVLNLTVDSLANQGTDALVTFDNYANRITKVSYKTTNDITLYNAESGAADRGSVDMTVATALNGVNLGNLLLDAKAARFDVRLDGGPATGTIAGNNVTVWNADRTESLFVRYDLTAVGGSEDITNTDQSLVFQIGANVGQTAKIGIPNMSSTRLAMNVAGNMFANLSEIDVTTVAGAQDSQTLIDTAILSVSSVRGTLGSFQKNTLESNLRNLRIAAQNLTASESMIRDADMAVEMSEFTKNQILVQAGTAMLAQANQIPQVVLSLF
jgi:flagellin